MIVMNVLRYYILDLIFGMETESKVKISPEERRRLDRQRFIGLETQHKLLNSLVMIAPANGPNTQLAKNLVLAGVNIALFDNADVTMYDVQTNFLIAHDDIGKKRAEVIYNRLKDMNPNGKNEYHLKDLIIEPQSLGPEQLQRFLAICTSFTDFGLMKRWDEITKKANKPFYNMVCCGFHSFAYISLGHNFSYQQPLNKTNPKKYIVNQLTLEECLQFSKQELKTSNKKEFGVLQAILMMHLSQKSGLTFDVYNPSLSDEDMLFCMVELGESLKENDRRELFLQFARLYGIDYCPVYSVLGSILSQEIIKVVENQQEPAMNWLVFNSEEGYCCVLKLKQQQKRIDSTQIKP